ncbi:MAG: hypothetical protein EA397_13295 [Deltaproteobacteria bacterium]|nr:MAG: hypothetical protein EA397_13295 [Deltaproteobacteria bacterium]
MIELLAGTPLGPSGSLAWIAPEWVVLTAVGVALVALVLSWFGERPILARTVELTAWALALAGLVVALARPAWVEEEGRQEPGRLAVLIDASRSMQVQEQGEPRHKLVDRVIRSLSGDDLDFYHFGGELKAGLPTTYELPTTDIESALNVLADRVAGEKLAGVVLITDGLDRGLLRRRYQREENPAPPLVPGALTIYQIGSPGDLKDLAVRGVDSGGFAFRSEPFNITARLSSTGYAGRRVTASLTRDGKPVTAQSVTLDDQGEAQVVFKVRPDAVGRFAYEVSVPVFEDDAVPSNNVAPVVVQVVRDRMSVLQVAGAPSFDVKFLRRFLKGDPSVDLVSFFILRTEEDIAGTDYQNRELSLIQFPYSELFSTELHRFDIIIFQNFDHERYFRPGEADRLLDNIRRFVEEDGKGFVMIGGDLSFDLGGYGGTYVERMLPVDLGVRGAQADSKAVRPALTQEGRRHPVTRLVPDAAENDVWWGRLPELSGVNKVRQASSGATVLLEHPSIQGDDGRPMPILSVAEAGKGRAMALTGDSSWRWSLGEAAEGRGNQAYLRFWKNSFRWLIKDPSTNRVTVDTPRENYGMGDTVRLIVRARDTGFSPLARADVKVTVTGPAGKEELQGVTTADGEVALEIEATDRGAHRVRAEVSARGRLIGQDETVYAVTTRDPELDEVVPDAAFLRWLAGSVDGTYYGPGEVGTPLRDPNSGRTVWDRRETPLWRAPALILWIGLFGGIAWIVRRRAGMR